MSLPLSLLPASSVSNLETIGTLVRTLFNSIRFYNGGERKQLLEFIDDIQPGRAIMTPIDLQLTPGAVNVRAYGPAIVDRFASCVSGAHR